MSKQIERRVHEGHIAIRSNADGTVGVHGYAAVFDVIAHSEVIKPGAFNRTLAQRDNIRLLVNHDGVPLAATKSGTLDVGVDDHGMWFDAPSLDRANPTVQELVSAMSRKDIDQCSFAGYFVDVRRNGGVEEVHEVKATDVSIVTYPWYEATSADLTGDRSIDGAVMCLRSLPPEARAQAIELAGEPEDRSDTLTFKVEVDTTAAVEALRELGELADEVLEKIEEPKRSHTIAEARALLASARA